MDISINRISSTVRPTDTGATPESAGVGEHDLERLAMLLLDRQQRLQNSDAARSLAPDDPAGELGSWER